MTVTRQVQLRVGSTTVDLEVAPFAVVAGSWTSAGQSLEVQVVVQASTLTELDRSLLKLRRLAAQAAAYDQMQVGDAVEVWTKTCDSLTYTAELGATWLKKRAKSLTVLAPDPSTNATGHYTVTVSLSLEVEELWRRALPQSVLEVAAASDVLQGTGSLNVLATKSFTGRRIGLSASVGYSLRVRWGKMSSNACVFFQMTGNNVKAWWDGTKFNIQDDAAHTAQSASYAGVAAGTEMEAVFVWETDQLSIYVNGVLDGYAVTATTLTVADTYTAILPSVATAVVYSLQIWAAVLTPTEATGLYAWGRPEMELAYCVPPADTANGNAAYKVYNAPGDAPSPLRVILDGAAQDYGLVRLGLRPLRIPTTVKWECESGTLGTDTASAADANASAGNVARFTPTATTWVTRVTVAICANPADVAAMVGEHRLLLACRDAAASVNINQVRWRAVVAGQAEAWSDTKSPAVVSTYSLLDLGVLQLPPGQWPAESVAAQTDVTGGSYVTIELQVSNTAGNGGGAFDLDALFLAPAEAEGVLTLTFDVSAYYALLDFSGERAAFIGVAEPRSLEFAAWGNFVGDSLELTPNAGTAGLLTLAWQRDAVETWYAGDLCDVWLYVEPRYRR